MAATVIDRRRVTTAHRDDVVVFIIGMRVNRFWALRSWWPVFTAMMPMVRCLYAHPESGFLGHQGPYVGWRHAMLIQYWRSLDDLERFARQEPELHPEAWKRFYRNSFKGAGVGIWHETYAVPRGNFETIYTNMPHHGLGGAGGVTPITGALEGMRRRMA